ncbi:MAG: D-amino-acid transaminase [Alphaproteobacteria bacterium]|nr:D-amino-acid transaminase [Alphaproteobacteria bacterium]
MPDAANIAYVNGDFLPEDQAKISIFDRGFLFGDGIYEVTPVIDGRLVDRQAHIDRLKRSLGEIRLTPPVPVEEIDSLQALLIEKNHVTEGRVYLQVSRGVAERDFPFPRDPRPSLVMFARQVRFVDTEAAKRGIRVKTVPDLRWKRRDIKTVMLLASAMAKQEAIEAGFDDAWLVEAGLVTEGSSNNAYIVKDGVVRTRHLSTDILPGCTRRALLALAAETGVRVEERPFSPEEAKAADEAFITSATNLVMPVVGIDEATLGDGRPGPLTTRFRELYIDHARSEADGR